MKYRKKPVEIEAIRMIKDSNGIVRVNEWTEWWDEAVSLGLTRTDTNEETGELCFIIKTLEGEHRADIGDYIIQGVKGELYPCKPDIFEQTYEAVE